MSHNNTDWVLLCLPLHTTFKIPIPNRISGICSHPGRQWSPKLMAQFSREWRNMRRHGVGREKELPKAEASLTVWI